MKVGAVTLFVFGLVSGVAYAFAQAEACGPTPSDCAVFHMGRGEFAAAIRELEQALARTPRDLKTLNLLGIALTGAGNIAEANTRFGEALRIDPGFYPALKNLAINDFNGGHLADAERRFVEVLTHAPTDEIAHIHLAEIDFGRQQRATALAHYERGRARLPQNPNWVLHYADCLLDRGDTQQAIEVLDGLPEGEATSRFDAGVALGRAHRYADAARFFASARNGYHDRYAAGYNETLMLVEAGRYDEAIAVAQELVESGKPPAELFNLVSRAQLKAGRIEDAYNALRTATRIEPEAEDNYVDLAAICLDHQNYDLGLEIVDIGLRYRPDSAILHLQRGVIQALRAELGRAEQEFDAARRLAPDQSAAYAGLAMIWMQTGQTQKAVDVLRVETRRRTADHVVPYIFSVALMRSGLDPASPGAAEAIEALTSSIRANAEFAPAHSELGRLLLKRDDVDGAIRELEKATALDPSATAALYNLAQAYRKKGDRARATELLARVSQMNAHERGDDPVADLRKTVVRIVRDGSGPKQ
jgi:tetratricopeptide (TPR) repeat protein